MFSLFRLAALGVLAAAVSPATTLTGLIVYGSNANGDATNFAWRTTAPGATANLTSTPLGSFLNGSPTWAISLPLVAGVNQFYFYGNSASDQDRPYYGLNLYFDGDSAGVAQISSVVTASASLAGPHAAHSANGSATTRWFTDSTVLIAGAGTLTFGNVTLTDFWVVPSGSSGVRHYPAGGGDNLAGFIELTVTDTAETPEPGSLGSMLAGLGIIGGVRRVRLACGRSRTNRTRVRR